MRVPRVAVYWRMRVVRTNCLIAAIAACLAKGQGVTEAVAAGFQFVEAMLSDGTYFE